jgi:hypothetical protein
MKKAIYRCAEKIVVAVPLTPESPASGNLAVESLA